MTQDMSGSRGPVGTGLNAGQTTTSTTGDAARDLADTAKETASRATEQVKDRAAQVADQARSAATSQATTQKERVTGSLSGVAQALRQTGDQLRDQDQMGVTGYIEQAASQVENFSNYLQRRNINELIEDVEHFARRQPALFLGGAFVLGLLGTRFLKSSRPISRYSGQQYSIQRYGGQQYGTQGRYDTGYDQSYNRVMREAGLTPTYGSRSVGDTYGTGARSGVYDQPREE